MHFDSTISLGNIVTIAAFILTIFKLHADNIRIMTRLETKVDLVWEWFRQQHKLNDNA